ncbi:hypothetical protein ACIRL0_15435 [Streptomyces sp. NPDC102365]|uniref:hypothetical protein n=1 Tax=Streptomyces sp. NPDC102365 TaxID=3366162 RepID=UPI0037F43E30
MVMLHSHVWNAHSEWHIRSTFARLNRSGVGLVGQHAEWCEAVFAADCIVSDHGSVSLYGAMTGTRIAARLSSEPGRFAPPGCARCCTADSACGHRSRRPPRSGHGCRSWCGVV